MEHTSDMINVSLEWQEISVTANRRTKNSLWKYFIGKPCFETFNILNKVSGRVEGGSLTAILGASGSGKTTLLATLGKRLLENVTGQILVDGKLVTHQMMRKLSGFLPQFDVAVQDLTVLEHLRFMENMKLSETGRIQDLINELSLEKCVDTRLYALSGGERKKLSLAVELLTKPTILFCDEPTSGLDSSGAFAVVSLLKDLTARGMTVICSIHQPSSSVFECFDNIILLNRGRIKYQGARTKAPDYFASLGLHCPPNYNAADFYIKQISEGLEEYEGSAICNPFESKESNDTEECPLIDFKDETEAQYFSNNSLHIRKPTWFRQVFLLMRRSMISSSRNLSEIFFQTMMLVATSVIVAVFFVNLGTEKTTDTQIQDIRGAFYMVSSEVVYIGIYSVISYFPDQLALIRRELGLYSISAFYVANILILIPKAIFDPILFLGITYGSIEFQPFFSTFLSTTIVLCIAYLCGNSYGFMFSAILGNPFLVVEVTTFVDLTVLLLAGMFVSLKSFPPYLQVLKHISMFFYTNDALAVLHWTYVTEITCLKNSSDLCLKNGTEVLDEYGFTVVPVGNHTTNTLGMVHDIAYELGLVQQDIIGLIILCLVMHFVAFLGLRRQSKIAFAL